MYTPGTITITNKASAVEIDIDGVIGVPEWMQFDNPEDKVATYDKFKNAINTIREIKASDVVVNIRSLGGDVGDALLIHDTLTGLTANVTTRCFGYVASAATIIAQAASKEQREISDNSLYLIHRSSGLIIGNLNNAEEMKDLLAKTDERIANIYANRSGKPIEDFTKLMDENNGNGKWLSPDEVIAAGLADKATKGTTLVNISPEVIRNMKLPEIPQNIQITNTNESMKIKDTWTHILNILGLNKDDNREVDEAQLEKLDSEIKNKLEQIEALNNTVTEKDTALQNKASELTAKEDQIAALQNKIDNLEAENAQLKAAPTKTKPVEDPAPLDAAKSDRLKAYEEDIKNLKS